MSLLLALLLPAFAIDPHLLEQIRSGMHTENPSSPPAAPTATETATAGMSMETITLLKRGTVLLRVPNGEGSGFFIHDEMVMTNRHVVEGLPVGTAIDVVLDSGTREGSHVTGYVAHVSEDVDLALVLVPGVSGRSLELVSSLDALRETTPVVAVGFPMGHIRSFGGADADPPVSLRPGAITALHEDRSGALQIIEHNTNMQQGNSGGPLVDAKGQVIGVNEAMLEADITTKIAIPSTTALAYLVKVANTLNQPTPPSQTSQHSQVANQSQAAPAPARRGGLGLGGGTPPAPAAPPAPTVPVIKTEIARPFEEGIISEIGIGPDGNSYVLLTNGKVLLLKQETTWEDIHSGSNNADISVDDKVGTLWVVESDSGHVVRYAGNQKWDLVGDGVNAQVAASAGKVWSITRDGQVMRYDSSSGWTDLQLTGTEEVIACDGVAYLRSGQSIWAHDGTSLANDGKALITGVKQMVCYQERAYGLMSDNTIVDLMAGKTIDTTTNNATIFPTPSGLLAVTNDRTLWYFDAGDSSWSKVQAP